jgi:hypothetical protein
MQPSGAGITYFSQFNQQFTSQNATPITAPLVQPVLALMP